jgi:hypothetical protein
MLDVFRYRQAKKRQNSANARYAVEFTMDPGVSSLMRGKTIIKFERNRGGKIIYSGVAYEEEDFITVATDVMERALARAGLESSLEEDSAQVEGLMDFYRNALGDRVKVKPQSWNSRISRFIRRIVPLQEDDFMADEYKEDIVSEDELLKQHLFTIIDETDVGMYKIANLWIQVRMLDEMSNLVEEWHIHSGILAWFYPLIKGLHYRISTLLLNQRRMLNEGCDTFEKIGVVRKYREANTSIFGKGKVPTCKLISIDLTSVYRMRVVGGEVLPVYGRETWEDTYGWSCFCTLVGGDVDGIHVYNEGSKFVYKGVRLNKYMEEREGSEPTYNIQGLLRDAKAEREVEQKAKKQGISELVRVFLREFRSGGGVDRVSLRENGVLGKTRRRCVRVTALKRGIEYEALLRESRERLSESLKEDMRVRGWTYDKELCTERVYGEWIGFMIKRYMGGRGPVECLCWKLKLSAYLYPRGTGVIGEWLSEIVLRILCWIMYNAGYLVGVVWHGLDWMHLECKRLLGGRGRTVKSIIYETHRRITLYVMKIFRLLEATIYIMINICKKYVGIPLLLWRLKRYKTRSKQRREEREGIYHDREGEMHNLSEVKVRPWNEGDLREEDAMERVLSDYMRKRTNLGSRYKGIKGLYDKGFTYWESRGYKKAHGLTGSAQVDNGEGSKLRVSELMSERLRKMGKRERAKLLEELERTDIYWKQRIKRLKRGEGRIQLMRKTRSGVCGPRRRCSKTRRRV